MYCTRIKSLTFFWDSGYLFIVEFFTGNPWDTGLKDVEYYLRLFGLFSSFSHFPQPLVAFPTFSHFPPFSRFLPECSGLSAVPADGPLARDHDELNVARQAWSSLSPPGETISGVVSYYREGYIPRPCYLAYSVTPDRIHWP